MYCDVLIYLRGNSIGTDDDNGRRRRRRTTHFKSFYILEEDRWDYSNECNKWEGGEIRNNYEPKQNRILENYVCNDTIRNNEVANILLSLNRENKLDNSCNDKKDKNGEGGNKGDINY